MSRNRIAVLLAASIPLAFVVGAFSPIGELGLLVALAVFVWTARTIPGFGGVALRGALAGAIAGILVLGIGFRFAMRVVAITEPTRTPEFTPGGTAFILVGIGLMLGAFAGAYLGGFRHILGLGRRAVALTGTIALVPMLFGDSEVLAELFELGAGGWLNIPMFTSIVFGYGWTQDAIGRRLDRRAARKRTVSDVVEPIRVP